MPTILQTMLSDDFDSRFLRELIRRLPGIYREAETRSVNDMDVHDSLKRYAFCQSRYVLAQSMFIKIGSDSGYDTKIHNCEANGFPIAIVKIGRFFFTLHHSSQADEDVVLGSSLIRQQCSVINYSLIQPGLFDQLDDSELVSAQRIYGNLIFGTRAGTTDFRQYGFLQIAVPFVKSVQNKKGVMTDRLFYAEKCDLNIILGMVVQREAASRKIQPQLKPAMPTIKKKNVN
jgi:hypothetical protein